MNKNKPIKKIRHLKNDKVFKKFFKNNQKPLISLLESFLPLPKSRKIKEVKVLDSLLSDAGKLSDKKESVMDLRCYVLNHLPEMGEEDRKRFASKNKQMEELMDWTRPLTAEESDLIIAEAMEKQRRDRVAQDEFVFEQGMEKGLEQGRMDLISSMLKKEADLSVISELTGLSIEELKKLKNKS